jgi:hypothetical protein
MKMRAKCLLNHDLPPRVSKSSSLTQGRKFKYLPLELADHHREGKQQWQREIGVGRLWEHQELHFPTPFTTLLLEEHANYNNTTLHLRAKLYIRTLALSRAFYSYIENANELGVSQTPLPHGEVRS